MKKNITAIILAISMLTLTVSCGKNVDNTVTTVKTGGHDNSHTVVIDKAVAATCTSEGKTEGKHCSACGEIIQAQEVISVLDHIDNDGDGNCDRCGTSLVTYSQGLYFKSNSNGTCYVVGRGVCNDLDIVIPPTSPDGDKVTSIGMLAFSYENITSITIPNSVRYIDTFAFDGCKNLTHVTMRNGLKSIGYNAFNGCTSLTSITIPNGVTEIEGNAFNNCTSIESITIPRSVTSIGNSAFEGCTSLASITIPSSVTSIGYNAFSNTAYFNNDANWTDGVLYIGNYLIRANTSISGTYTIKDGIKRMAERAFSGCADLTSITISDSVTEIGPGAFEYCTNLTSITIPSSVKRIEDTAFYNCMSLTSITIPSSVTKIGYDAFGYCWHFKKVYYTGTAGEWAKISIDSFNLGLTDAAIYYYSETEPTADGNFWHYVDGNVTEW